jgi:hypothetical protein
MDARSNNNEEDQEDHHEDSQPKTEGLGTFLNDIIPYDRKTPIDTEVNPHTLPDLPALRATIRPAGVRRGKVNYTVDELPEIGRTILPEIEAARWYLLRGEHPKRKIDITYPEHRVPEFIPPTAVNHEKRLLAHEVPYFLDPDRIVDRWGHYPSVYATKQQILRQMWNAHNEDSRRTIEHSERERAAGNFWPNLGPYLPMTFKDWKERIYLPRYDGKFKRHGAIPGTAKIAKDWPPKREGALHFVTVVWQTKPTAADVRKARKKWEASLPRPDHTASLAAAAHLRDQDTDGAETRKVLRKAGFTVEKYDATEEFRALSEVSWEQDRAPRRWSWIADQADQGQLPYFVRGFFRQTKGIPRKILGHLLAQKIRRGVDAAKIGRPLDPLAEHAWDLEHGFAKVTKPEQRILDAGGSFMDAAVERAKLDAKNAAKLDMVYQKAAAAEAEHDAWRRRGFDHWIEERGKSIAWGTDRFEFEGKEVRLTGDLAAYAGWRDATWLTADQKAAWSERSTTTAEEDAETYADYLCDEAAAEAEYEATYGGTCTT